MFSIVVTISHHFIDISVLFVYKLNGLLEEQPCESCNPLIVFNSLVCSCDTVSKVCLKVTLFLWQIFIQVWWAEERGEIWSTWQHVIPPAVDNSACCWSGKELPYAWRTVNAVCHLEVQHNTELQDVSSSTWEQKKCLHCCLLLPMNVLIYSFFLNYFI